MISVQLDGERREIREGSTIQRSPPRQGSFLLLCGSQKEGRAPKRETRNILVVTTAGEVVIELTGAGPGLLSVPAVVPGLAIGLDRQVCSSIWPFSKRFRPRTEALAL